jgi:aryl-alcohol dehydrogenase-like predicted oxidoreductase
MLEGKYTLETVFPPSDHRSHRPRQWLVNGLQKIETLRFLETANRTLGQAAIQWLLAEPRAMTILPNIYDAGQLAEFGAAPDTPALTPDELARIAELAAGNFGVTGETNRYKGTMTEEAYRAAAADLAAV